MLTGKLRKETVDTSTKLADVTSGHLYKNISICWRNLTLSWNQLVSKIRAAPYVNVVISVSNAQRIMLQQCMQTKEHASRGNDRALTKLEMEYKGTSRKRSLCRVESNAWLGFSELVFQQPYFDFYKGRADHPEFLQGPPTWPYLLKNNAKVLSLEYKQESLCQCFECGVLYLLAEQSVSVDRIS